MAFRNVPLPGNVSAGSDATPTFQVDIARAVSGNETRVGRRTNALRRFSVPINLVGIDDVYAVITHFEIMEGPLHSFPYKDRLDFKSCAPDPINVPSSTDVTLGTGDGATASFQCRKIYSTGGYDRYRTIYLPKQGTLLVAVDTVLKTETTHYTVNYETGVVTFTGGNIPTAGQAVTAGFEFYCKVRYDMNDLQAVIETYRAGGTPSIALIEVPE